MKENQKKQDFNASHPELKHGEIVLCNAGEEGLKSLAKRWKTMRIGTKAFSTDGEEISNCVPVFVSVKEKLRQKSAAI